MKDSKPIQIPDIIYFIFGFFALLSQVSCTNTNKTPPENPLVPKQNIILKTGQVWNGNYFPDHSNKNRFFQLLISEVNSNGYFKGIIKSDKPFYGNGNISGNVIGSEISFSLIVTYHESWIIDFKGTYSDQIRGAYQERYPLLTKGKFTLNPAYESKSHFITSYQDLIELEKASMAKNRQIAKQHSSQPSKNSHTNPSQYTSSYQPRYYAEPEPPRYRDDYYQMKNDRLMERQTEALESIQREQSWNNFEKTQRFPWQQ
jgi:hypothetical protein